MGIRQFAWVVVGVVGCGAGPDSPREAPDVVDEAGVPIADGTQWRGEGEGWDGTNRPGGDGYQLHYLKGGYVVEADLSKVSLLAPDPLTHCGSMTAEWAEHDEQAARGVFAAVNANFFECDANSTFTGRTCPLAGEPVPASGALAVDQFPIGVHCGDGNCFDNTAVSTARYMSHLVVKHDGDPAIVVYEGDGTPAGPPFATPYGHKTPGAVADADVAFAASGAPTLIRDGAINDKASGWSSLYYYERLANSGSIPFVALSYDRQTAYLGLVQGGGRLAAEQLLANFSDIEHAIAFDAGASPTFWFKGGTGVRASRRVPTKLALASAANVRAGVGHSRCSEAGGEPPADPPPSPPPGPGGPRPE